MSSKYYTLVYGLTGSGKSSLLNILCGNDFASQNKKLIFNNGTIFEVSGDKTSLTQSYQEYYLNTMNMNFVDTPGIQDTNIENRIKNLYKLHKYFEPQGNQQKLFKFIFLISEADLDSKRGQEFRQLMDELFQLFKNIESFQDSVLVVFSKIRPYKLDSEDYQEQIQLLREDFLKYLIDDQNYQKSLRIQKFFKSVSNKNFLTFSKPHSKNECNIVKTEKDAILQRLQDNIQFINKIELNTQHQLDAQVKQFMKNKFENFQKLKNETNELIFHYLVREIIEDAEMKQGGKTQKLREIEQKTKEFKGYIEWLQKIQCSAQIINQLEKLYDILLMYNTIENLHKDQFNLNTIDLNNLIINQTVEQLDRQTLTLKTFYLHSSEIDEKILKKYNGQNLKKLIIIVEHAFIFDSKVFSFHGGQIALRCKKFIIAKLAQKLDLSGQRNNETNNQFIQISAKKGEDGKDQQDGEDGKDGLPGNPGENGGYFLMYIENKFGIISKNDKVLYVDVSGGQGYDGQDGGNGGKGGKGFDGDLEGIFERKQEYLHYVVDITDDIKNYLSLNRQYALYYQSKGKKGFKGGNGGKGGCGGFQGNHGDFQIISWDDESQIKSKHIQEIKENGFVGQNGKSGQAGSGGEGGKYAIGIYKSEYFCPTLRGIASEMNKLKKDNTENQDIDLGSASNLVLNGGAISLSKFVTLPIALGLTSIQALVSVYMAANNNEFIKGPKYHSQAKQGDNGNQNHSINAQNQKYPDKTSFSFKELKKYVYQSK